MTPTVAPLPTPHFPIPATTQELLASSGSSAGYHAVSTWLGCPERSRLRSLGIRRKARAFDLDDGPAPLDALGYGLLLHACLGTRIVHGNAIAERLLARTPIAPGPHDPPVAPLALLEEDRAKALLMLRTYDSTWPIENDPWQYIGVETEVIADIGDGSGGPCLRTARYDAVVQINDPVRGRSVMSLEHKTAARPGMMREYTPQAMVQVALWNACPSLVETYGPMTGVVFDVLVKQTIPKCERLPPRFISRHQIERAIEYLRLPLRIPFPINADGSYPRLLNECYGKFAPCDYVDLCIENVTGEYEWPTQPKEGT